MNIRMYMQKNNKSKQTKYLLLLILPLLCFFGLHSCSFIHKLEDVSKHNDYSCRIMDLSNPVDKSRFTLYFSELSCESKDSLNQRQLDNLEAEIDIIVIIPGLDSIAYSVENKEGYMLRYARWGKYALDKDTGIEKTGIFKGKYDSVYFEVLLRFTKADSLINEYRFVTDKDIYCDYHNCEAQEKY